MSLTSLRLTPLTPQSFHGFGKVVVNPTDDPSSWPKDAVPDHEVVNQGTAEMHWNIADLTNNYVGNSPHGADAKPYVQMFVCSPRKVEITPATEDSEARFTFSIPLFERHRWTAQTFLPLGVDKKDPRKKFLVVVAPYLNDERGVNGKPDASKAKAFVAHGGQGVSYGQDVWHSPMIALWNPWLDGATVKGDEEETEIGAGNSEKGIAFITLQFRTSIVEEDVEESHLKEGELEVVIDRSAYDWGCK